MNISNNIKLIVALIVFSTAFVACDRPGPAETAGKKAGEKMEKAGEIIDDSTITTKIKASILAEPGLRSFQISVETVKGEVTLSGNVDSQQDIDRAEELASAVSGVKSVNNQLVTKSQ